MPKNKSSKIRIFVGYKDSNIIFQSDVFQPIFYGAKDSAPETDFLKDNTGINIASKNKHYGELTGHYWVWKNLLSELDVEYIGFCHYRRFLDFNISNIEKPPFRPMYRSEFEKIFKKKYTEENILNQIKGYDIVLPNKLILKSIVYAQYLHWHPEKDMNLALNIIRDYYPDYIEDAKNVMSAKKMYNCLNFVMKKELFNDYMEWIFGILTRLEQQCDWSKYKDYLNIRTPAFIAERFFNIWLEHNIKEKNLKVLNTTSVLVIGKGYGNTSYKEQIENYALQVKLLNEED